MKNKRINELKAELNLKFDNFLQSGKKTDLEEYIKSGMQLAQTEPDDEIVDAIFDVVESDGRF